MLSHFVSLYPPMGWLTITRQLSGASYHVHRLPLRLPCIMRQFETMKKEVIIAILIGFGIGLLITLGIHTTRSKDNETLNPSASISPTPALDAQHHISIVSPLENAVQSSEDLLIKGQTTPDSMVILETEKSHQIKIADESGFFEADYTLVAGPNLINITSYHPSGTTATFALETTYAPETDSTALDEKEAEDES